MIPRRKKKNPLVGKYFIQEKQVCQICTEVSKGVLLVQIGTLPGRVMMKQASMMGWTFYDTMDEASQELRKLSSVVAAQIEPPLMNAEF